MKFILFHSSIFNVEKFCYTGTSLWIERFMKGERHEPRSNRM